MMKLKRTKTEAKDTRDSFDFILSDLDTDEEGVN
jgi:hypothetical protein